MPSNQEAADRLLSLEPEQYFDLREKTRDEIIEGASELGFEGIRLGGPTWVNLDDEDSLPVLYLRRTSGLRDWEALYVRNSHLVAVDLNTGRIWADWAFPTPKRFKPDSLGISMDMDDEPDELERASTSTDLYHLDARTVLRLPWEPARFALWLVYYDWVSNGLHVELEHGKTAGEEPALDQHPRILRERALSLAMENQGLTEGISDVLLELEGDGTALAVEEPTETSDSLKIEGLVRLPVPEALLVEGGPGAEGDQQIPAAFLRVSLLLIQLDELHPQQIDLMVPVFSNTALEPGAKVEARFALDLFEAQSAVLETGKALIYTVAGSQLDGPWEVQVSPVG